MLVHHNDKMQRNHEAYDKLTAIYSLNILCYLVITVVKVVEFDRCCAFVLLKFIALTNYVFSCLSTKIAKRQIRCQNHMNDLLNTDGQEESQPCMLSILQQIHAKRYYGQTKNELLPRVRIGR